MSEQATASRDTLLAAIAADERELARVRARQLTRIAALDAHPVVGVPAGHADDTTQDELQCLLRLGSRSAGALLQQARTLRDRLPATLALMATGQIGERHARTMIEHTAHLTPEQCTDVEQRVLAAAPRQSPANLARSARRAALRVAPETADERRLRCEGDRKVVRLPGDGGVAELVATLPEVDAWTCWLALDTRARIRLDGDTRTLDQRRADALTELCSDWLADHHPGRRPGPHGVVVPVVHVTMTHAAFENRSDEPAEVEGVGPVSPGGAHRLTFTRGALFTRTLVDEHGTVLGLDPRTYRDGRELLRHLHDPIAPAAHTAGCRGEGLDPYRPASAQANLVAARDPVCVFPYCTRRAARCDTDHTKDHHRGGSSCHCNLHPLCRHHHNAKTRKRWQLTAGADGSLTWTSPTGRRYSTGHTPARDDGSVAGVVA